MSKINCVIDTEERTMSVEVDGKAVSNVRYLSAYFDESAEKDDYYRLGVEINQFEELDGGMRKITRLVAAESDAGERAVRDGFGESKAFAGFIETPGAEKVAEDISKYFS